jgi:hypothetical protein
VIAREMKIARCSIDRGNSYQAWNIVWPAVIKPSSTFYMPRLRTVQLLQFGLQFQLVLFQLSVFQVPPSKPKTLPVLCRHRAPEEEVTLRQTSDRISRPLLTRVISEARRDIVILRRLAPIPHVCDFRARAYGGAHARNANLCVSPSPLA